MSIYSKRREQLLEQLPPRSLVIIASADEVCRNADTTYPFRQESHFYYLTGFSEPNSILVLYLQNQKPKTILFVRPNHPEKEIWTGKRAGLKGACDQYEADEAYLIHEFNEKLQQWLPETQFIYYPFSIKPDFDRLLLVVIKPSTPIVFRDVCESLGEMRLIKSTEEIALMKKTADISAMAHIHAMQVCRPNMMEYELAAEYMYIFLKNGCESPAYTPIVASGVNACTLHYIANQSPCRAGELVLVDAAGEYHNYAADITRTYPVNGKFSAEQRAIYEIVWCAQQAVIQALRPGVSVRTSQEISTRIITEGLVDLGLLKGSIESLIEQKAYFPFFMHGCSHWLGLDTHDAGSYKINKKWRPLMTGMVLTVEPGIYIRPETGVDVRWHNIGVRIEDDILITTDGCEVLTNKVPSSIYEIETIMANL